MNNEIKTFVYRSEVVNDHAEERMIQLKEMISSALASAVMLIMLFATVSAIVLDKKNVPDMTAPLQTAVITSAAEETTPEITAAPRAMDMNISKIAAVHKDIPLYAEIFSEEDDSLMLLGLDGDETQVFIPEEMRDKAEVPTDAPDGLVYSYSTDMILDLDAENLEALERIVEAEACDQDLFGKMLVANVVINRVYAGFADTVKGVIFQKLGGSIQFSPVRKGGSYYTVKVCDETKEAVARVLSGEDYSQGALYFFQRSTTSARKAAWFDSDLKYLFKYGTHEFYKEKD